MTNSLILTCNNSAAGITLVTVIIIKQSIFVEHLQHTRFFKNLFIYGCAGSLLLCMDFLYFQQMGSTLFHSVQISHCDGFSCCRAQALKHGLSNCGTWVQLLRSMWNLPRPRIELISRSLASEFLTTGPPGKSHTRFYTERLFSSYNSPMRQELFISILQMRTWRFRDVQ